MRKTSGIVKAVPVVLLALFLLISCGPEEYNGFNLTKNKGVMCVELPFPSGSDAFVTIPLSYYQISEVHIKNLADLYNRFNLEADDTIAFYKTIAGQLADFDSEIILEDDRRSFEKWKSAMYGQNLSDAAPLAEKISGSIESLVSVIRELSGQDPLLNTTFTAEDFFNARGKTEEIKAASAFISHLYPGVKIISEFSERTPFVLDETLYIDFPLVASVNEEGESLLLLPESGKFPSIKMPRLFYEKIHSIAKKMAIYYNSFSETDRQVVTELFEGSSELHLLEYNLLDFFPMDKDRVILLDWLRYVMSLPRNEALSLTGGLKAFCRAQWLYSYKIISVLDDINWNCSYYGDKDVAVRKTWTDYVYKKQDFLDALVFFEESFPDIAFVRSLDEKIQ
ncbi:MAG: hypothetical protein K5930_12540 [Treponemataceae bacterium]|nr:hypothetical protein [Treponemataceae bacterium]